MEINIDYILMLVEKYHDGNCEDKEILASIRKAVDASIQLRSKKDLIEAFLSHVNVDTQVTTDWRRFVLEQEESDLTEIITSEKLKSEETRKFVDFGLGIAEFRAEEQEKPVVYETEPSYQMVAEESAPYGAKGN